MGHTIDFVIAWFVLAAIITAVAGVVALLWRRASGRDWSDVVVLEGAVAMGVVLSFVILIISIARPS